MSLEVIETAEGGHFYQYKGKRVPGVSEILEVNDVLLKNSFYEERKEAAALRGKDVHLAAQDLDRGWADWWSEDETLAPYIKAYIQFKKDCDFQPSSIEQPCFHETYQYAGQPDRFGDVMKRDGKRRNVTLDIKAVASIGAHVPLQLAGYNLFTDDSDERDLVAVQLKPNGKYTAHFFPEREHHTQVFMACLTMYFWKTRHHPKENV